jgi:hypothetical protein
MIYEIRLDDFTTFQTPHFWILCEGLDRNKKNMSIGNRKVFLMKLQNVIG